MSSPSELSPENARTASPRPVCGTRLEVPLRLQLLAALVSLRLFAVVARAEGGNQVCLASLHPAS